MVDQLDKHWLRAAFKSNDKILTTGVLCIGNFVLLNAADVQSCKSDVSYLGEDQALYGVNDAYLLKAKLSDKAEKHFMKLAEFSK